MDVLSEILSSVRSVAPLLAHLCMADRWGIDMEEGGGGTPFHYVASGSCWLSIGDDHRQLEAGDLVLLPAWPRHALVSDKGESVRLIREMVAERGYPVWSAARGIDMPITIGTQADCDVEILSGIFGFDSINAAFMIEALPGTMHIKTRPGNLSVWLDAVISLVRDERERDEPGFGAVAGRAMEFIFIHALRTWMVQLDQPAGWLRGVLDPRIGKALSAIHGAPARHWNLAELAGHAGQSRAVFAGRFRDVMGETPFGYLTRWRMSQAAARLSHGGDALAVIAQDLGYGSASALARAFHAQFACTPADYRKRSRSMHDAKV